MDEDELSSQIIGAAIEVHRVLGPGMLESTYQVALAHELRLVGLKAESEVVVGIRYKDLSIPNAFRIDLMVEGLVVLEIKAVEKLLATHEA